MNQTDFFALVPDNTPLGGSCMDYHVTDDDIGDILDHNFTHILFELNLTYPGNKYRLVEPPYSGPSLIWIPPSPK